MKLWCRVTHSRVMWALLACCPLRSLRPEKVMVSSHSQSWAGTAGRLLEKFEVSIFPPGWASVVETHFFYFSFSGHLFRGKRKSAISHHSLRCNQQERNTKPTHYFSLWHNYYSERNNNPLHNTPTSSDREVLSAMCPGTFCAVFWRCKSTN